MKRLLTLCLCLLPGLAHADTDTLSRTLRGVVLPAFADLATSTQSLADAAQNDCRANDPALQSAYHAAFDAWLGVELYRPGPLEDQARGLAIAFWPDTKAAMPKAIKGLLALPAIPQGPDFAETSVAGRGLFALEAMLYDPAFNAYGPGDRGCQLVQAITADLAQTAKAANTAWTDDFGPLMQAAGAPGNTRFMAPDEAIQLLYTAALTELEFIADTRIGRPLGDDRARPNRAEARASGRSLRNVVGSVEAVARLAHTLAGVADSDMTPALDYVIYAAGQINDPAFADVDTSSGHFRLLELQNAVKAARRAVQTDLGARLGVPQGFNALDGD